MANLRTLPIVVITLGFVVSALFRSCFNLEAINSNFSLCLYSNWTCLSMQMSVKLCWTALRDLHSKSPQFVPSTLRLSCGCKAYHRQFALKHAVIVRPPPHFWLISIPWLQLTSTAVFGKTFVTRFLLIILWLINNYESIWKRLVDY